MILLSQAADLIAAAVRHHKSIKNTVGVAVRQALLYAGNVIVASAHLPGHGGIFQRLDRHIEANACSQYEISSASPFCSGSPPLMQ